MRLEKCDKRQLARGYKDCKNQEVINEFIDSGYECAEIKDFSQSKATICAVSFNRSIKRMEIKGIKAVSRGERVFILRSEK